MIPKNEDKKSRLVGGFFYLRGLLVQGLGYLIDLYRSKPIYTLLDDTNDMLII
jgi:hypothetical protein